ncbi:hypothetical protein KUCAC02_014013 [Chaenocephalus aceratus]|uniref:Uncharacterized protein n=1 Tax=Chaenocephalus aceratus TaxID=36190 RepID=A0ACB9WDI1_CHAAC|nr:hypothetical protein KUCAC02_014013 [Chaenocephalus aceratus]
MSTWRQEFFEAVDLLTAELKRRCDQDSMKIAALRENVLIEAANSRGQQQTLELESLHLPQLISDVDRYRLDLQLKMLGDAIGDSPCHTDTDDEDSFRDIDIGILLVEHEGPSSSLHRSPASLKIILEGQVVIDNIQDFIQKVLLTMGQDELKPRLQTLKNQLEM